MSMMKQVSSMIGASQWKNALSSNKPINPINVEGGKPTFLTGIPESIANYRRGDDDLMSAVKNTHMKDGKADHAKIAGSFMVAGVGYRAVSGGGVYRDSEGNTDVAGIPFI